MNSYRPNSLLPSHCLKEEKALDMANGARMDVLSEELQKIPHFYDTKNIPFEFLASLADATGNDIYFFLQNLDEAQKRKLLEAWIFVQRKKGTPHAIKRLFLALELETDIEEWVTYNGTPYRFRISINQNRFFSKEDIKIFFYGIFEYGNVKSILEYIHLKVEMLSSPNLFSSVLLELPNNFYKRALKSTLFYKSSVVGKLPNANFYSRKLESKLKNKGVIIWQL